jgi:hypothetical protein
LFWDSQKGILENGVVGKFNVGVDESENAELLIFIFPALVVPVRAVSLKREQGLMKPAIKLGHTEPVSDIQSRSHMNNTSR